MIDFEEKCGQINEKESENEACFLGPIFGPFGWLQE
jgi:hypothetical protein